MQIHELNNYNGDLDSNAYFAVDNGNDTGKVSADNLFAGINSDISQLSRDLNGRIDNIIGGGDAPSAAEVLDARRGANGIDYPSLGDAIRSQVSALNNEIESAKMDKLPYYLIANQYINNNNGKAESYNGWSRTDFIYIGSYSSIVLRSSVRSIYNAFYSDADEDTFISRFNVETTDTALSIPSNAKYIRLSNTDAGMDNLQSSVETRLENSVSSIETEIADLNDLFVYSENRFCLDNVLADSYMDATGTIEPYQGWSVSDYLYVNPSTEYALFNKYGSAYSNISWAAYTGGKEFITGGVTTAANPQIPTTVDTKFVRISAYSNYFEEGSSVEYMILPYSYKDDYPNAFIPFWREVKNSRIQEIIDGQAASSLPAYYYENGWLETKIQNVKDASDIINGQTFAFITDTHFGTANEENSKYLLKEVIDNTTVPFVVCGGDIVGLFGSADDLIQEAQTIVDYQNYIGKDKFYSTRGNHDFYNRTDSSSSYRWLSEGQAYDILGRNAEKFSTDMIPAHLCYVIKNDAQNTIILMINSKDAGEAIQSKITGAQAKWICDELLKFKDKNIIAISHIPADPGLQYSEPTQLIVHTILSAFNNRTEISTTHDGVSLNADFSDASGEVVCHICGHSHLDESNEADGVLSIVTTCDAHYADDGHGAVVGTVTEQAFDVFCIDYDARTITAVRIGRGNDRTWSY